MLTTSLLNHIVPLAISMIATPLLTLYLFNTPKYKTIGTGMSIGLIPLGFITFIFYQITKLH
ncbi:hypothetical protein H2O64_15555 [Kordia sp. YSTF-M3]|uniref:Uncharacterized protein n=1 Tax=Kordia aestuariivivens TaxID=2759037 RepID=A0ABR7QC49_9FLAO|nr:hypothetical protein [Kordia aestuariivivens]MBC8756093.1 hypothetical protein [Kordia aestuariivivens]